MSAVTRLGRTLSLLRPSTVLARGLRRIFSSANNRWLLAGAFAVYVLRSLTKGPLSRRFPTPRGTTRLEVVEGARYVISTKSRISK
ncbi:MAG: hypothetical protein ACYCWN_09400 [Ferrimicrobium sp.]|uniref:hypothetical protein n=1 Tax=Ferrimicrobium TaxID=121038 RepID=UPI002604BCD6|nr:hypothetical protein [Ferrimicrobium sp.]